MPQPQFVLKATPPRLPRTAVLRRALAHRWDDLQDRTAILVTAPRGFGKTTLLVQWRRAWLERGAFVAWLTLDSEDTPGRFAEALLAALHGATGRTGIDALSTEPGTDEAARAKDLLTTLLAEIAALATPTVVVLDDADRLPAATLGEAVSYLIFNAPPNLRFIIGTRGPLPLEAPELVAKGELAQVGVDELRLTLDDTVAILQSKFGDRISLDDCARLHEMTEGWPIGLQMAAATVERARELGPAIAALSARRGDIERYFLESMLSQLPPELADFLVRCSILDSMSPELCAALTGDAGASLKLEHLMRDTPIVIVGEGQGWMRLHMLARDFLRGQFEQLPAAQRRELHARAADWYAQHHLLPEAAHHALESGDEALAYEYAATSLREIGQQGKLAEAREWVERLPASAFERDVRLRLSAAWMYALSERAGEVFAQVDPVAADTGIEPLARLEAGLVGAAAAVYCDQPGRVAPYLAHWTEMPPGATAVHFFALANPMATVDLFHGEAQKARARYEGQRLDDDRSGSMLLVRAYVEVTIALTHMWEARPARAEALLQPGLERAEREAGRRSVIASMLAGVLSGAVFERDQPARARALLANRVDVIDRVGTPDAILIAYRTLADLALADGDERRALDALGALRELGERRSIPRMAVLSLAEQVRIHAVGSRPETAAALLAQLEAVVQQFKRPELAPLQRYAQLKEAIARAYAAIAGFDDARAGQSLRRAAELASALKRGREVLMIRGLQAVLMHRQRDPGARARLQEVRDLAAIDGLERLVHDLHPLTAQILGEQTSRDTPKRAPREAVAERSAVAVSGGLLTAKETEILRLLTNGLSNKLIARSMDISDETVKWHLKNLFSKLNAGTRRHAVDRARLLGLVN
ncbi:MAG TPA: LuxR C-terminal-related transcriptional regulator [Burkholderiaceae bacterium]|nr:LuxR C-terminal-related transcriptional regulator [Burkholderiaceae bacterium]HQR70789.1 LuxR C-terminal-related transcriptional regulator [Burkholderiaceae bacterium]